MAHSCIKYRLTQEGTIPDFLYLGEDGVGGMYPVADPSTPSPRDMIMIGISVDNATGDFETLTTKEELQTYLAEVGSSWTQSDPSNPGDPMATVPFDTEAAANWVWDRLDALNA